MHAARVRELEARLEQMEAARVEAVAHAERAEATEGEALSKIAEGEAQIRDLEEKLSKWQELSTASPANHNFASVGDPDAKLGEMTKRAEMLKVEKEQLERRAKEDEAKAKELQDETGRYKKQVDDLIQVLLGPPPAHMLHWFIIIFVNFK